MRPHSLLIVLLAAGAAATGSIPSVAAGQVVSGTVRDSIAHRPLPGAVVQLVPSDGGARPARAATADSLGRFEFSDVVPGRYIIGFLHPLLDSLGIEPVLHELVVARDKPERVALATPAAARLRSAMCRDAGMRDSSAVVVGFVRDAHREPVGGATVIAEWMEMAIGKGGVSRNTARAVVTSKTTGWFAVCNVPASGTIFLRAARGDTATDAIALDVPNEPLLHRDLYVGASHDAVVRGVVTDPAGTPLAGARVMVAGADAVRSNAQGEWVVSDAPAGTRTIEVRAIGYYPQRIAVDALEVSPPLRVVLSTLQAVLDTVRVNAQRRDVMTANGFQERRRMTTGHFMTAEDVARTAVVSTSQALGTVPGLVLLDRDGALTVRGIGGRRCAPGVFLDARYISELTADEIDGLIRPEQIAGIEVYMSGDVPAQFTTGSFGWDSVGRLKVPCGAIVIWTKPVHLP